jgi:geranylgeranyl pyrophosphate synthase
MGAKEFKRFIEEKSEIIDMEMEKLISEEQEIGNLHDAVKYALGLDIPDRKKRGKRIRPILCLLTVDSLGGNQDMALTFAISIEFLHNFFLVHDDIEDGDKIRRNRPSVWVNYGLVNAINIGDFIFSKAYLNLNSLMEKGIDAEKFFKLYNLFTSTADHTIKGQALDMNARYSDKILIDEYMHIVREKTGYYLSAPIIGGAIISDADEFIINSIKEFSFSIGPMFQIIDDVIDLTTGKGRGEKGSDIKEGKRSFLTAFTMSKCTSEERARLVGILNKSRESTSDTDIIEVMSLYEKYNAVEHAKKKCEELFESGTKAINKCPSTLRDNLITAARFMIERET